MPTESSQNQSVSDDVWTVRRILEWTTAHLGKHGSDSARLDAEILLAHARKCQRIELYTRYNDILTVETRAAMRDLVRRRAAAEPVAYLVGHREFFSLDFKVTSDTLIPRPDTESLVIELLEIIKPLSSPTVLDLCTGSGCIAIATAVNAPHARLMAADISQPALVVATYNRDKHQLQERIQIFHGDLFASLPTGTKFDVIVSNPPYVRADEMATLADDIKHHEPHSALVAGDDGLQIIRRIVEEAPKFLVPKGHLLLEFSPEQTAAVASLLKANEAYDSIKVIKDLSGRERAIQATTQS